MKEQAITKQKPKLLYLQITEKVLELIREGHFKPHDPIPSEGELAGRFGVSRMTCKLALELLAKQGVVYRLQRKGTFLADQGLAAAAVPLHPHKPEHRGDLPKRERPLIAIVLPELDDYTSRILTTVEDESNHHACDVIVKLSRNTEHEEQCLRQLVQANQVDGIILFPRGASRCSNEVLRLKLMNFPIVIIDRIFREIEIDCVYHDHFHGMYKMTKYLIEHGHDQIGFISQPFQRISSREERYQGYIQALIDHTIPIHTKSICVDIPIADVTGQNRELDRFLQNNDEMTAIVCIDDYVAAAVLYSASRLKIPVPGQLSIVGFSDIQLARFLPVPLTTAKQSTAQLGKSALSLLHKRMNHSREQSLTVKIDTEIVERASVKQFR